MSGSSLDGLDACLTEFSWKQGQWNYQILEATTIPFDPKIEKMLVPASSIDEIEQGLIDQEFGKWIGKKIKPLASKADLIGLHGHTTKHEPENRTSIQIGNGQVVANLCGKPTVSNFRMADIMLGGQGAPLVPMGEKLLFPDYDSFMNLGGICNASIRLKDESWIAGDIGPFNQVLNFYSSKLGKPYDDGGEIARSGSLKTELLKKWQHLEFFQQPFPKSLSNDWVRQNFFDETQEPRDCLNTFTTLITDEIAKRVNKYNPKKLLITGGGAYNHFVIDLLREKVKAEVVVPEDDLINFKEALIFGLLAQLRVMELPNVLSSCTGASSDSCGGDLFFPA